MTALVEAGVDAEKARITAEDTYVPPGPAADVALPSEDGVFSRARDLLRRSTSSARKRS